MWHAFVIGPGNEATAFSAAVVAKCNLRGRRTPSLATKVEELHLWLQGLLSKATLLVHWYVYNFKRYTRPFSHAWWTFINVDVDIHIYDVHKVKEICFTLREIQ